MWGINPSGTGPDQDLYDTDPALKLAASCLAGGGVANRSVFDDLKQPSSEEVRTFCRHRNCSCISVAQQGPFSTQAETKIPARAHAPSMALRAAKKEVAFNPIPQRLAPILARIKWIGSFTSSISFRIRWDKVPEIVREAKRDPSLIHLIGGRKGSTFARAVLGYEGPG